MIVLIFIFVLGLHFIYLGGNLYAAWRFYKFQHPWGLAAAIAFLTNATQVLHGFISLAFSFRPQHNPLWANINTIVGLLERTGGILFLNLCLLDVIDLKWIKRFAPKAMKDKEPGQ